MISKIVPERQTVFSPLCQHTQTIVEVAYVGKKYWSFYISTYTY
jgi:hypothetical protein